MKNTTIQDLIKQTGPKEVKVERGDISDLLDMVRIDNRFSYMEIYKETLITPTRLTQIMCNVQAPVTTEEISLLVAGFRKLRSNHG